MSRFRIATILASLSCAFLVSFTHPAHSDELQDINKLYKQGQHDKALERLESYLTSRPKDAQGPKIAQGRFLKGVILAEQGKNAEAVQIFTRLTEEYPELPEPYNNLAVLYASQGQYDKARHALEMAINTHPSYATAHENLGDIYAKMASQAYDKALQLDKSNVTAQTKLALVKELFSPGGRVNRAPVKTTPLAVTASAPTPTAPARTEPPKLAPAPATTPQAPAAAPMAKTEQAKPQPAPAEQSKSDSETSVLNTLNGWAKAWSSKNVSAYLAHYAKDFKTPRGENRASWEKTRKDRISKPKSIQVDIDSPRVTVSDATHASVTFKQVYKSAALQISTQKTLDLVKSGDKWLIQQERIGR
ncbi:MAG: tetratricopeptide repeat protein [Gammaproteobacteria bacterium]|nr:tetratricopeptide repeat protein [Gammaproteobacteria bacterium]